MEWTIDKEDFILELKFSKKIYAKHERSIYYNEYYKKLFYYLCFWY